MPVDQELFCIFIKTFKLLLLQLHFAFQDAKNLYMVMDYMAGKWTWWGLNPWLGHSYQKAGVGYP